MPDKEAKDAAVVVDLRGTVKGRVVLHDIMAGIGSYVYIRDGIVVYVQPPPDAPVQPDAPKLLNHHEELEEDEDATPVHQYEGTHFTHAQLRHLNQIEELLRRQKVPRKATWISDHLKIDRSSIYRALRRMTDLGLVTRIRLQREGRVGYPPYAFTITNRGTGNATA